MIEGVWGYTGSAALFTTLLDGDIPAMAGFDVEFLNGDHHLKNIFVGGKNAGADEEVNDSYLIGWGDEDFGVSGREDDRVNYKGIYYAIGSPHLFSTSERSIRGTSTNRRDNVIPIPRLEDDEILVLRGFEFRGAADHSNHHIRSIEVRYNQITSAIRVNFLDNSPDDDEYDFLVRYFVLKRNCTGRWLCLRGIYTDSFIFSNTTNYRKTHPGKALLAGFKFHFMDNDHHIRRIAIDVEPGDEITVAFTDSENNHRVRADIDYVILDWSRVLR